MTDAELSTDARWSHEVVADRYAGHPGLRYRTTPSTLGRLLGEAARWSAREFLVSGQHRLTFADLYRATGWSREHLRARGVGAGDRVMVFGYNSPEWVTAVFSLWSMGAVPVLANRWWSPAELRHALDLLEPRLVLADAPLPAGAPAGSLAELRTALAADRHDGWSADGAYAADQDAPALVLFTSGSSGMPKAVELSARSVIANQHNILGRSRRWPHLLSTDNPQVVSLASTPWFHIGGLSSLLTHFLTGGRIVLAEGRFDAGAILELIERERVAVWGAVPTMAVRVLEHPRFDAHDLSSLRSWPLGGAPVSTELLDRIRSRLPQLARRGLSNTWGMTEAGGFLTVADGRDLARYPDTVGRPYPVVELRIADPDPDGVGEVLARSPTVMLGYAGRGDDTVDAQGWLHTGDVGHLNDEGYLFIDGRRKDIVIRGGENIACPQVEAALATHPTVTEAAALGVPHPDLGEELVAVVVHRPGTPPPTEQELRAHLSGLLAYFAIPTRWQIRSEPLPTLAAEKVDKRALAAEFTG